AANDNRAPAGKLVGDTLELRLTVSTAEWRLVGDSSPALTVAAFGEEGKTPTIPGPLLRVRAGTPIHVVIRNPLDDTLIVRGFSERGPATDSLVLPPGGSSEARFARHAPGTFQYWATLANAQRSLVIPPPARRHGLMRAGFDSQLTGAFVVDPPGLSPEDRIFVITEMVDQKPGA